MTLLSPAYPAAKAANTVPAGTPLSPSLLLSFGEEKRSATAKQRVRGTYEREIYYCN